MNQAHNKFRSRIKRIVGAVALLFVCGMNQGCGEDSQAANLVSQQTKPHKTAVKSPTIDNPIAEPQLPVATPPDLEAKESAEIDKPAKEAVTDNDAKDTKAKTSPRVTTKKPAIPTRNGKTYRPAQLHKNQTLLVLAAQPDIRAELVIAPFRTIISEEQNAAATRLALNHDSQFKELLRERAAILESAYDGNDVESKLLDIKMRTADLLAKLRIKIQRNVLSKEQRAEVLRLWNEWAKQAAN